MEVPLRHPYSDMTPRLPYARDARHPSPPHEPTAAFDPATRMRPDVLPAYAARGRALSDPRALPPAGRDRAFSDTRPGHPSHPYGHQSPALQARTRPPNGIERFVRADDPASQNPLRRLVGRVCGVTPARATELYLRREEEGERGALPAYGGEGVIMPPGMGLDLDFDVERDGGRLARSLERGAGRGDHLHAARG